MKNFGTLLLREKNRPALGKPADRHSNNRATYVNPITNIFPCLTAQHLFKSFLTRNELVDSARRPPDVIFAG